MKILTIAIKDLWRAFRSFFALAFMFGVPILMTVMFAFLFGGIGGDNQSAFSLPSTDVILVNLDKGSPLVANFEMETGSFATMGDMLVDTLQEDTFTNLMTISLADESDARSAVNSKKADMAIIIPPDFTDALIGQSMGQINIEFYQDPTLSMGSQVVQAIVMNVVDGFSSGTLSLTAITNVLTENGVELTHQQEIALRKILTEKAAAEDNESNIAIIPPSLGEDKNDQTSPLQSILRSIMAGMMIFYAFFTGTSAAQTILQEEENGTLARMFISPTESRTILHGKFLAGFLMIIVQVAVLLIFANLIFGIQWGPLLPLAVASIGLVALATSFGIFIMSLVKNTKQAGIIYGAVLTFTGMLGISSVFVTGTPVEKTFEFLPLIVPQGWAMNAFRSTWNDKPEQALIFTAGVLLWSLLCFVIGNTRFKKRFG